VTPLRLPAWPTSYGLLSAEKASPPESAAGEEHLAACTGRGVYFHSVGLGNTGAERSAALRKATGSTHSNTLQ